MFGKEKPGRVCCLGRVGTPTLLKRNKEILEIEKRHADEVKKLNDRIQEIEEKCSRKMVVVEEKHCQEMAAMDQKFQLLLKVVLHQKTLNLMWQLWQLCYQLQLMLIVICVLLHQPMLQIMMK
uniref:Uncharacterized protein n=1 Tax=Cajanus cajan TaxID=3821 RepID=A0A151SP43_CAJCA|nr:hypothetical protein KK1_002854 [Cajanus cajan]